MGRGEKIPAERELCLKLGVGRASLREALKALEIMGMIETRLRRRNLRLQALGFSFRGPCSGPLPAVLRPIPAS